MKNNYLLFFLFCFLGFNSFAALPVPSPVAPANFSVNQTPNVLIDWSASTGQTYYELEYGTDPLLQTSVQLASPTASSFTTSELMFGTVYYWRVRAMSATDSSAWSATSQFTTIDICSLVAPANGATQQTVNTLLDWSAISGVSFYDFQADTSMAFNSIYLQNGSVTTSQNNLAELQFGKTYYWRIRARHSQDTTQWSVVYSFSTLNDIGLVSPANGAVNQVCNVLLDWSASTGLTFYDYQCDLNNQFNSAALVSGSVSTSSVTLSNLYFGETYYWRIRMRHSSDTSAWSQVWTFSTLNQLNQLSPVIGASNQVADQLLDWAATTGLTYYEYQADVNSLFYSSVMQSGLVTASQVNLQNLYFDTTYYWRIRGINSVDTTQWSAVWNFSVLASLTHVGPANGSLQQAPNALIDWSATTGTSFYDYQADISPSFNSPNLQTGSVTASQVNLNNCLFGQMYYWRARARHAADTMDWSSPWTFTITDQLTQVSPANGATAVSVNPIIDWSPLAGIVSYEMCLDDNSQMSSPQCFVIGSGSSQQNMTGLAYGETYYWRVRAIHALDTSSWTPLWSFTTGFQLTTPPSLISPADLSTNLPTTVLLEWGTLAGAINYQWQIAENNQFVNPISGVTSNLTQSVSGLQNSTIYFWRVRANNGAGYSPWSSPFTFSTIAGSFNTPPVLLSPADLSVGLPLTVNFSWGTVSGAVSYEFAIDSSNIFSNPFVTTLSNPSTTIASLVFSTQYFWRVRAFDGSNFSPWSPVWSFTTIANPFIALPALISPADLATNVPVTLSLSWGAYAGASVYEYEYSTDPFFTGSIAVQTGNLIGNISGLQYNTTYYWRVRAGDGLLFSPWSLVRSFVTESNPFFVSPNLSYPTDLAINVPVALTFLWSVVPTAVSYQLEYDTDPAFSNPMGGITTSPDFAASGLLYDTTYYWRVRAYDGVNFTLWSNSYSFSTESSVTGWQTPEENEIAYYPNPVRDWLMIDMSKSKQKISTFRLINAQGAVISEGKILSNQIKINLPLENVAPGVYTLQFTDQKGWVTNKKIIHQ